MWCRGAMRRPRIASSSHGCRWRPLYSRWGNEPQRRYPQRRGYRMVVVPRIVLVCCLLFPLPAFAARTAPADQPVALKLELGQQTAVIMLEPILKVVVAQDEKVLSTDYEGVHFFVLVKDPTYLGRAFVVLQSGKLQRVDFKVASPPDDIVSLVSPAPRKSVSPFSVRSE